MRRRYAYLLRPGGLLYTITDVEDLGNWQVRTLWNFYFVSIGALNWGAYRLLPRVLRLHLQRPAEPPPLPARLPNCPLPSKPSAPLCPLPCRSATSWRRTLCLSG